MSVLHGMKHPTYSARSPAAAFGMMAAGVLQCFAGMGTAADSDAEKVDPCKLITQPEAQSALGMPVKPGEFVDSIYRRGDIAFIARIISE
jgi:hypothetical protein